MFKNLITKINLRPSLAMRSFSVKPNLSKQMVRYPVNTDPMNLVFGMASNLMRNFEREFDYVTRKAYDNYEVLDTAGKSLFDMADESFMKDLVQVGPSGERNFKLQLNLKGFDPEEIKINTEGQMLQISAKKERKTDTDFFLREFSESFSLPKDLNIKDLKSKMTDGLLVIEAKMPVLIEAEKKEKQKEKQILIEHKTLD